MHLSWNPLYRVHLVPAEGVFLLADPTQSTVLLDDVRVMALAPLLAEGQHTAAQLATHTTLKSISPAEIYFTINWLRDKQYIVEIAEQVTQKERVSHPTAVDTTSIHFTAVDNTLNLPPTAGLRIVPDDQPAPLRLVLTSDEQDPALAEINQRQLVSGQAWLLARPTGQVALAAFFAPRAGSACWACVAERWRNLRPTHTYLDKNWPGTRLVLAHAPAISPTTAVWLSDLLTQVAAEGAEHGRVWLGNAPSEPYPITKRPQCPACGDPTHMHCQQSAPPQLTALPAAKEMTASPSGQRRVPTAEMLARLAPHMNPVTGLVRTVQPTLRGALWAATTQHNVALPHTDWRSLRKLVRGRAGGKGRTAEQATLSAVAETIERYTAVWQGDEPVTQARLGDLPNMHHPHELLLFSTAQYAEREAWNRTAPPFNFVPEPFDPTQKIGWSAVWSVLTGEKHWVPTALLYYGYAQKEGTTFGRADSNGCAAGSSLGEAFVQGFMEVVERDAVALWWYNRVLRPAVAWETWGDVGLAQAIEQLRREEGREVWFLDVTSEFALPTFTAVSRFVPDDPRTETGEGLLFGFGTHFDPQVALWRALAELGQMVPLLRGGVPTAVQFDPTAVAWWRTATLANQPYLMPDVTQAPRTRADFGQDVGQLCLDKAQIAELAELEVLVLDQTRPDTGLHVVKVIVPGLRHFWARFAPGRLYTAPVALGWRSAPLAEDELNPWPLFL